PVQHDQLALSPITHEHFAKLTALSCIVREPARWHIALPHADSEPRVAALPLDAATDVALLAALAGSPEADVARLNPAARNGRLPAGAIALLPEAAVERAKLAMANVPRELRTGWRRVDTGKRDWRALSGNGIDAALLAEVNGTAPDATPPARVLVRSPAATAAAREIARAGDANGRYAVRAGDSLWKIARRFRVTIAALLEWNALTAGHVLRPGQVLWVAAPR
ncbi:MAG TPA: LysM peptidoglycan-binding domain-containing protein, partial [Xanthomonadales bacterium]|nr:LysM peptidoglycan-binding domain-containing protein [Xanthomonadales bacterium]